MSQSTTPTGEDAFPETMDTEEPTQEVEEPEVAEKRKEAAPAKAKKAKAAPDTLIAREPGKSVLPFSRVQKILKADKDLCMVQREAAFLISLATEDFVARFTEAIQRSAGREGRATVQGKDVVTTVRRAEEFAFLEELFPWSSLEAPAVKRKPKALQEKEKGAHEPTMLDQFVSKPARDDGEDTDEEDVPLRMNIVTNEDGTLSMGPPAESEPS